MEPYPFAQVIHDLPEFSFLSQPVQRWVNFQTILGNSTIVGEVQVENNRVPLNSTYFQQLYEAANPSKVGVGSETVYDPEIRASSELDTEDFNITLYPQFKDWIYIITKKLAQQLEHPTEVTVELYKVVLYQPGDFFEEHIDSDHGTNLVMSLSVELPSTQHTEGGDLIIEGETMPRPGPNEVSLNLFYHDCRHKISPVISGNRISLIFNVIQTDQPIPEFLEKYRPSFVKGIEQLRQRGVNKVGFLTNHLYIGHEIQPNQLKGRDCLGYQLFKEITQEIQLREVINEGSWCYAELLPLLKLCDGFGLVYNKYDPDRYNDEEEGYANQYEYRQVKSWQEHQNSYDQIKLLYDEKNKYRAIRPEFKMGDVVLLKTSGKSRVKYTGNEELHTGNEGFEGTIYDNLAVIAHF